MEYLKFIFNRNIYNIIYNYADQSKDHLIKIINTIKYRKIPYIESDITILDVLSKAVNYGYRGFYKY